MMHSLLRSRSLPASFRPCVLAVNTVIGLLTISLPTAAQTATGVITTTGSGAPVRAAWIILVDESGTERGATLTDSTGRFAMRAPAIGRYTVRATQLGFEDVDSRPFDLVAGGTATVNLALRPRALPLAELTVEVEQRCDVAPEEGTVVAVLWQEAKKGLAAVRRTGAAALVTYRTRQFERTLDLTGRKLTETFRSGVSRGERPFTTPPPEELAEHGFVEVADTLSVFYAPDAEVLLSDSFAETHCFRPRRGRGETAALVGLAFEPAPGRDVADIAGALWIDTATAALRYIEFRYTGIDYGPRTRELGGRIDFGRLPSGAWITERWVIKGPVIGRRTAGDVRRLGGPPLAGFKEAGAELVGIISQGRPPGRTVSTTGPAAAEPDASPADASVAVGLTGPDRFALALEALGTAIAAWPDGGARGPPETPADSAGAPTAAGLPTRADLVMGMSAITRFAADPDRAQQQKALDAFEAADRQDPGVAPASFGAGLAHVFGPDLFIADAAGYQHRRVYQETNAELSARRALFRAVELDPRLAQSAIELVSLALATRNDATIELADSAAVRALSHAAGNAALRIAASDAATARHDYERGAEYARQAIDAGGGAPARHALGVALVRIPSRVDEGAAAYLQGLTALDAFATTRYWDDIRFILPADDAAVWTTLGREERGPWLRSRWERTAAENAVTIGDRLATHMARVERAHALYRRQQHRGARPADALQVDPAATDAPFDARGLIYIRHGPPDEVIQGTADPRGLIGRNLTWAYRRGGAPIVFHFMKLEGSTDWQLTGGPPCDPLYYGTGEPALRAATVAQASAALDSTGVDPLAALARAPQTGFMDAYQRWHDARVQVDPGLSGVALRCMNLADLVQAAFRSGDPTEISEALARLDVERRDWMTRRADLALVADRMLTTEQALPDFETPVDVLTAIYTFRGQGGMTDVAAALLVPGDGFSATTQTDGVTYGVRLSLILMDPPHERVFRRDTLMEYAAVEPVAAGQYLRTIVDAATPPMDSVVFRLAVRNDDRTDQGRVQAGRIDVPDYSGDQLMISDLVMADGADGQWQRGFAHLSPIPTHQFAQGSTFRLYYEVYNLEEGNAFSTRLRVQPASGAGILSRIAGLFGGRDNEIDLRFDDIAGAQGPHGLQHQREIGADLEPGSYIVTVTVRNEETGLEAMRETRLNITGS